jgi:hypothetical protein
MATVAVPMVIEPVVASMETAAVRDPESTGEVASLHETSDSVITGVPVSSAQLVPPNPGAQAHA